MTGTMDAGDTRDAWRSKLPSPATPPELEVRRNRFKDLWADLPQCTVLAAPPGWGKTTWLEQASRAQGGQAITWVRDPEALLELYTGLVPTPEDAPNPLDGTSQRNEIVFVDDMEGALAKDKTLWKAALGLSRIPGTKVVVACYDPPPDHSDILVIDERTLAFTKSEIEKLSKLVSARGNHADMFAFNKWSRGCPWLLGREAQKQWSEVEEWGWHAAELSPDQAFRESFPEEPGFWDSKVGRAFNAAHGLPRFTEEALTFLVPDTKDSPLFERMGVWPTFEKTVDQESGEDALKWTTEAWRVAQRQLTEKDQQKLFEAALAAERERGSLIGELFTLLTLGRVEEAEQFAETNLRRLLLFAGPELDRAVLEAPLDPANHPALSLLRAELRRRHEGDTKSTKFLAQAAADAFSQRSSRGVFGEFARASLVSFAAVSAGDRPEAQRFLRSTLKLADAFQSGWGTLGAKEKRLIADHLYLAYWAAIQLDDHEAAGTLAELLVRAVDPADRIAPLEQVSAATQADLDGRRLEGQGSAGPAGLHSNAVSLRDLQEGRDEEAVGRFRMLAGMKTRPSRSALDALELLVKAIAGPPGFSARTVDSAVNRSVNLWGGEPSSFVAWAAIVACSTIQSGRPAAKYQRLTGQKDAFGLLAKIGWQQWSGEHRAALETIEELSALPLPPRFDVLARVLQAASLEQTGRETLALRILESALQTEHEAQLMRFAFRLVPEDVARTLLKQMQKGSAFAAEVAKRMSDDARPVRWVTHANLTPAETEVLDLLRRGSSNEEIAEARFVAVGTVRNQLKSIYKKLGVSSRSQAVEAAYERGVFYK